MHGKDAGAATRVGSKSAETKYYRGCEGCRAGMGRQDRSPVPEPRPREEGAPMIVTPLYAGLLTLLFMLLSYRVVQFRQKGVSLGDGGDPKMLRVIRGHANFAEYVPLALLMMAVLELGRTSVYLLHAVGIALILARALHAYALSYTPKFRFGRFWGAALTFAVLVVEAVLCLWQAFEGMTIT
jgi:uncharacterized membrane protein YecN with MAPEG domain